MKKLYTSILFILLLSISCKKDLIEPTLKDQLQGNWNYQKLVTRYYQGDGVLIKELVTPINSVDYGYVFYSNGTCTQRFGGEPAKFTYEIISDTEFEVNTGSKNLCRIISIDETDISFVVGEPQKNGSNYSTSTHYLSR